MAGSTVEIASLSLAALAEAVDSEDPTPGGGAVAACAAALASALAGMAARFSVRGAAGEPGAFAPLADRAAALRARCLRLADDDAAAYASYAAASRMPKEPDPHVRQQALGPRWMARRRCPWNSPRPRPNSPRSPSSWHATGTSTCARMP